MGVWEWALVYSFQQRYQILLDFAVYSIVNVDPFSKVFSQQWFAMTPVTFIVSKTSIPEFPGYVKNNCLFHHTIAPSDVYLMKPLDQRVIWSLLKIVSVAGHVKTILIRIKSWKIVTKLKNRSASNAIIAALIICFFFVAISQLILPFEKVELCFYTSGFLQHLQSSYCFSQPVAANWRTIR